MVTAFDVIVIGSGIGGFTAAKKLAESNLKVAVVEGYLWGGTTPNHGSTAKKYLLNAVEVLQNVQNLQGNAFDQVPQLNWAELMAYTQDTVRKAPDLVQEELLAAGIHLINGEAVFVNDTTIRVNHKNYQADRFIVASGARPRKLAVEGEEYVKYSKDFLAMPQMPKKITIIGAGIIAFALINIANACGAEVHVLQHNQRALTIFDQTYVKELIQLLKERGVVFHFDQTLQRVCQAGDSYEIQTVEGMMMTSDAVFCVAGRIPNVEYLDLEKGGVAYEDHGIKVDEYLRTTNPRVYALGDCVADATPKLANYAEYEGNYLAKLLGKTTFKPIRYPIPAMSVFSNPKLAQAGVTINEALQDPARFAIVEYDMENWLTYHRGHEKIAKAKVIIDKAKEQVVGITSISHEADLLINYAVFAINAKLTKSQLEDLIFAYPSLANDLKTLF